MRPEWDLKPISLGFRVSLEPKWVKYKMAICELVLCLAARYQQ